ncbi:MAG: PAS domain-containing protein [Burkholderiales bacterium]|nr:PAS domain-containing protein [Burkholderiales bacterium]
MPAARPLSSDPGISFWRSLQTLNISRVVVAISLLVLLSLSSGKDIWANEYVFSRNICILYLSAALGFVALKYWCRQHFMWQLAAQILLDILAISTLYLGAGGSKSGLAILYLFPLAGAGILAPLLWAFFFTSIVTLFVLTESIYRVFQQDDGSPVSQVGLYGAAYFAAVYVVNRLAGNLIRQEQLATRRGQELAVQQAINRLVIADMGDGILVLDQFGRLFEINPAAERMLGGSLNKSMTGAGLDDIIPLRPIVETMKARAAGMARHERFKDEDISFVSIRCYLDEPRVEPKFDAVQGDTVSRIERPHFVTHLKLRFVAIDEDHIADLGEAAGSYTIIFMQDVSDIENQAQQLKLASMGRLTASIAHEVRNPLSSISYAASLLNEDVSSSVQDTAQAARLLKIVDDNVARLNQLIEDILKLSRKARTDVPPYRLMPAVAEFVRDFAETKTLADRFIKVDDSQDFKVSFDPGHLREVVVNLLSNAIRYASGKPGSIRLYANLTPTGRQELHIQDDGPAISYDVRAHLFEPFYTTSRMGTGLGLYMARELCLNNRALLDYEYRSDDAQPDDAEPSGRFVVNFSGYSA